MFLDGKQRPLCTYDYNDDKGEYHPSGPTIEHRTDVCESACPFKYHLHPNEIHPATAWLLQLRLKLDAGAPYDRDEIANPFWLILGEMKRTLEQKQLLDMGIMMFGTK